MAEYYGRSAIVKAFARCQLSEKSARPRHRSEHITAELQRVGRQNASSVALLIIKSNVDAQMPKYPAVKKKQPYWCRDRDRNNK